MTGTVFGLGFVCCLEMALLLSDTWQYDFYIQLVIRSKSSGLFMYSFFVGKMSLCLSRDHGSGDLRRLRDTDSGVLYIGIRRESRRTNCTRLYST